MHAGRQAQKARLRRTAIVISGVLAATATVAPAAHAMGTTVTTLADSGPGSLRQVVADAPAGATVDFAEGLAGTIALASELVLGRDVTVRGPGGAGVALSGQNRVRVLRVAGGSVRLRRLTIRNGFLRGFGNTAYGAGILVGEGAALTVTESTVRNNETWAWGGGIYNSGALVVERSTIADNVAGPGGGIANSHGALTIRASTIATNVSRVAFDDDDYGDAYGGGVANVGRGRVLVERSTLSGNRSSFDGGAIASQHPSEPHLVQVVDSTITANQASVGGGIETSAPVTLRSSILAGNRGRHPECNTWSTASIVDGGHNLVGSTTGCTVENVQPSTALRVDPRLGPLNDNRGPTRTHHPLHDSPAIDAGAAASAGTADQRGVVRPPAAAASSGRRPDIGAVEADRPFGTGTLAGAILDGVGAPIARARVSATGPETRTTTTGTDGRFAFDLVDGRYQVVATAYGFAEGTVEAGVRGGQLSTVDLVLQGPPRHRLTGTVRDSAGATVAGAPVSLDGTPLPAVMSAEDGTFSIDGVFIGDYTLRVGPTSCVSESTTAVSVSGPTTVDVVAQVIRDAFGYGCSVSTSTPYQGAANPLGLVEDYRSAAVPLPFAFPYYGQTYDEVYVCMTGYIAFVAGPCRFWNSPIPDGQAPHAAAYGFWDDMYADRPDTIRTEHVGAGDDERFVVEFHDLGFYFTSGRVTFSIALSPDGGIAMSYRGIDANQNERGASAVVGIESPASDVAMQYSAYRPVLSDGLTISFRPPT